jgi:hypothetical protein
VIVGRNKGEKIMTPKLTKREHFAIEAMKGILSNASVVTGINLGDIPTLTKASTLLADSLIKDLDAKKNNKNL